MSKLSQFEDSTPSSIPEPPRKQCPLTITIGGESTNTFYIRGDIVSKSDGLFYIVYKQGITEVLEKKETDCTITNYDNGDMQVDIHLEKEDTSKFADTVSTTTAELRLHLTDNSILYIGPYKVNMIVPSDMYDNKEDIQKTGSFVELLMKVEELDKLVGEIGMRELRERLANAEANIEDLQLNKIELAPEDETTEEEE